MEYINFAYDTAVVLIILVSMYIGKKNGFAKTFIQTFGTAASIVAAMAAGNIGASLIYTTFIEPSVIKKLEESIGNAVDTESVTDGLRKAFEEMPAISKLMFDFGDVEEQLSDVVGLDNAAIAKRVEETVIEPLVLPLIETVFFILTLVILLIIVGLLAKSTKGVNDVPVVGPINGFFGAVLGTVSGAVYVCIAATVIDYIIKLKGPSEWANEEIISKTYLFRYVYAFINGDILPF